MKAGLALCLLLLAAGPARAGAWTQAQGHWQIIAAAWASDATHGFDSAGAGTVGLAFRKALFQTSSEYGWTDRLTLFADTETAYGDMRQPLGAPARSGLDNGFAGGARYRLEDTFGVLSAQASFETAGAYNFADSANGQAAGRTAELRLLYGTNFKLAGNDGFVDIETAMRWLSAPRPDETPLDLTAGVWLTPDWMAMAQSFNVVSSGDARPPYTYYRSHKLELSLVRRLSARFSVQVGAFFSPFGQNALAEQGVCLVLWTEL